MDTTDNLWWRKPQRVIQPNLQVKDTAKIDPARLAHQLKDMGASAIVFNVGGIYAWYDTKVKHHTLNEYLPTDKDLLKEVIAETHKQGLRFIARLDFSKTEDIVFLQKPKWFVRRPSGEPEIIGAKRPGHWSLLMSTCINGPYRNEAVAVPVLEEVLHGYEVDGVFFNAPQYVPCWCEGCQSKYLQYYGSELPAVREDFARDWPSRCLRDNVEKLYAAVKRIKPEAASILYYNLYRDNLYDRIQTTDMLCTEPQDVLSLGHHHIPEFWKPALSIKLGRSLPDRPSPFGIVHSSPGMEWRHTGLPPAEYRFWLSQIPAHGGSIWHSLTGIPDTIGDKRILQIVSDLNRDIRKVENDMDQAAPLSEVALIWTADATAEGWADGLINRQIPFDVLLEEQATVERLAGYKVLVIPGGMMWSDAFIAVLDGFVRSGGRIVVEGRVPEQPELLALLGIGGDMASSEPLKASYLRFEGKDNPLQRGLEQTELIAHQGTVVYTEIAGERTEVLATLVPPFSPPESVGAPPERASLPVSHTDIPLALARTTGQGKAYYLPFELSGLINQYKLGEHYRFMSNLIETALGGSKQLEIDHYPGLQTTLFRKDRNVLLHLVDGIGRRPLAVNVPLHDIQVKLRLPQGRVKSVRALISEQSLEFKQSEGELSFRLPRLDIWECLRVEGADQ